MAAITIRRAWKEKERNSVPRRRAPSAFVHRAKVIAPTRKPAIETSDRSHPLGAPSGCEEAPSPRTIVFPSIVSRGISSIQERDLLPVCIARKQDHALKAQLSHSPVFRQSSRHTRSANVVSIVSIHFLRRFVLLLGRDDTGSSSTGRSCFPDILHVTGF